MEMLVCNKCGRNYDHTWKICLYCECELVRTSDAVSNAPFKPSSLQLAPVLIHEQKMKLEF